MAEKSSIEWTRGDDGSAGATWNPVTGCTKVSEGCDHCYATTLARRLKAMGNPRYQLDGPDGQGLASRCTQTSSPSRSRGASRGGCS